MSELISAELCTALPLLDLSPMLQTLGERAQPYQDLRELVRAKRCKRRDQLAASQRARDLGGIPPSVSGYGTRAPRSSTTEPCSSSW